MYFSRVIMSALLFAYNVFELTISPPLFRSRRSGAELSLDRISMSELICLILPDLSALVGVFALFCDPH
jgi:hypothetical protein